MSSEAPFSRRKLLQSEDKEFLRFVSSRAHQFAVLGYTDVAKRIVSRLNAHENYHSKITMLWLLWASLGEWPVGEEEKLKQKIQKRKKEEVEEESNNGESGGAEGIVKEEKEETTLTTKDIQDEIQRIEDVYADTWFFGAQKVVFTTQSGREQVESLENKDIAEGIQGLLDSIEELEPAFRDASTGAPAMDASVRLVSALDLRWLLKKRGYEQDGLVSVEELMDRFAKRMEANQQLAYLMQSRRAWEVLKEGALAKAIGVNDQKVRVYAKELEETLDERIRDGKLGLENLSMRQMLEILEHNTRTDPESLEIFMDEPPENLFHDPASLEEIAEAEKELGVELPPDYKEFLTITNGFEQSWGGVITDPPLHPVSELRWFEDDEDYFTDLDLDLLDIRFWSDIWPTVGKAIEIGAEDIDNVWLIPPSKVQEIQSRVSEALKSEEHDDELKKSLANEMENFAGSIEEFMKLEWCLVTWAAGGAVSMHSYPSFTAYTRNKVEKSSRSSDDGLSSTGFFGYQCV